MKVKFELNGETYEVDPCPNCGSGNLFFDAGMLAGTIKCIGCDYRVVHEDIFEAIIYWGGGKMKVCPRCNGLGKVEE
jgi:hypothetical protein